MSKEQYIKSIKAQLESRLSWRKSALKTWTDTGEGSKPTARYLQGEIEALKYALLVIATTR